MIGGTTAAPMIAITSSEDPRFVKAPRFLMPKAKIVGNIIEWVIPIYAVVLIGFFHSIMFPTIFALGIKNLGAFTKRGSSLLLMAIIEAAVVPPVMGEV